MNHQPIEKLDFHEDGTLDLHSLFFTIQGEGPFCGQPAMFVRLAGCNLQCPGCDTDYTSTRRRVSALMLRDEVMELYYEENGEEVTWKPIIVITGGEPFRQNIAPFVNIMVDRGWHVQIETNGSLPPPESMSKDVDIVVSPKTGKINSVIEERAIAFKYVVKAGCIDRSDGLPIRALDHPCAPVVAKPPAAFLASGKQVFLQPYDDGTIRGQRENLAAAVRACKRHGHTLQVQIHKIASIE